MLLVLLVDGLRLRSLELLDLGSHSFFTGFLLVWIRGGGGHEIFRGWEF